MGKGTVGTWFWCPYTMTVRATKRPSFGIPMAHVKSRSDAMMAVSMGVTQSWCTRDDARDLVEIIASLSPLEDLELELGDFP